MFDRHKASHFYLRTDKGIQRILRVLIYHLMRWDSSGKERRTMFRICFMVGTIREVWGNWCWVEPCSSHLLSTENLFSLSSLAKMISSLLSKSHIFWLVSIVTVVELIVSFSRPEGNTRIFLLMWVTVSTIAW